MRKQIEALLESNLTTNKIATDSGVSQSVVHRLRSGERTIGKLSIETGEKLQKFWEDYNMITITAMEEGTVQSQETFKDFEEAKQHLLTTDYFSWIKDNEPDRELPDFKQVENIRDVEAIFEDYNYDWWTMTVERGR